MKHLVLLAILFMGFSVISFGQTYSFSKLVKKATVETSSGNQQRIIGTYQGPYKFVFESPNDPQIKRLFTLLNPGQANGPGLPWYGLLKEMGYVEKDDKLLKKYLYLDTDKNEQVLVLIADDYSQIILFRKDDTIWEFSE